MKKAILFVFLILLISLSACKSNKASTDSSATAAAASTTAAAMSDTLEKYLRVDLPQIQKENQRLYYVAWGKLAETSYTDSVSILSDAQYTDNSQSNVYMVADVGGTPLVQESGTFDKMVVQNGEFSLADIDGDDVDEIVVHFEVSGNGGTITRVYKVKDGAIILLSDLDEFDTGFISEYENDYKLLIANKNTGYAKSVDISKWVASDSFDEKGKAVIKEDIFVHPFSSCEARDIDDGGKFELYCSQDVSLSGGYIGKAYTTLRYNLETDRFEVVDSEFVAK